MTTVKQEMELLGKMGEEKTRKLLMKLGYTSIQSPDWTGYRRDDSKLPDYVECKVKTNVVNINGKEYTGLNTKQIKLRTQVKERSGIKTLLVIYHLDKEKFYCQYLDYLEESNLGLIISNGNIKIYPLRLFEEI